MHTRRTLLARFAMATAGLGIFDKLMGADRKLSILFLGGTGFLGPHTVRAALASGHDVTLFNRGLTNPGLFGDLDTITGDRNTRDIEQLGGRHWDAVIDTSAYFPRSIDMAMGVLAKNIEQYVLISTTSVYETWSVPDMDESAAVRRIADPTVEEYWQPATYGALKALCEEAAEAHMPGRVTTIRPGFIVGPGDGTDRFTYWPVRVSKGGEVLAPGTGDDHVQLIDVRDLGNWLVQCLEQKIVGTFNAHAPAGQLTMRRLLDSCCTVLNAEAELTWVDTSFLEQYRVTPLVDMPLWLPGGIALSAERAHRRGLMLRSHEETIRDTWDWFSDLRPERQNSLNAGILPDKEIRVLVAWHASRNNERRDWFSPGGSRPLIFGSSAGLGA